MWVRLSATPRNANRIISMYLSSIYTQNMICFHCGQPCRLVGVRQQYKAIAECGKIAAMAFAAIGKIEHLYFMSWIEFWFMRNFIACCVSVCHVGGRIWETRGLYGLMHSMLDLFVFVLFVKMMTKQEANGRFIDMRIWCFNIFIYAVLEIDQTNRIFNPLITHTK